jgi:L-lactate dehydrogenase (cytochrome)
MGQRHVDIKNGLTVPPSLKLHNLVNMLSKPRWVLGVLTGKRWNFGNLEGWVKGHEGVVSLAQWVGGQFDQSLNWKDIEWIRSLWRGPLILKGILDPEDARLAVKAGASAIVVSNHGGRQLDGAPSSISMLAPIAQAVGLDVEVMFDGGVRSGQDVLRAMALGARACMIGRAYIFGLGADGQAGARKAIEILRRELEVSMALTGVDCPARAGPHILVLDG